MKIEVTKEVTEASELYPSEDNWDEHTSLSITVPIVEPLDTYLEETYRKDWDYQTIKDVQDYVYEVANILLGDWDITFQIQRDVDWYEDSKHYYNFECVNVGEDFDLDAGLLSVSINIGFEEEYYANNRWF